MYTKRHLPDIEQWSRSSGSNVIPRRARPGLAGLRPHNLFKARRLVYHSTLGLRVIKKKRRSTAARAAGSLKPNQIAQTQAKTNSHIRKQKQTPGHTQTKTKSRTRMQAQAIAFEAPQPPPGVARPYSEYSRADSYPWSPVPPRRALKLSNLTVSNECRHKRERLRRRSRPLP